ncbi:MAG: 4-hydroxybenzoate octaprenyltransferase [Rhodospirillaceae bacterium]|nr:4-hydroxybenzoate octaprenyltransferase [Rhodospirillaceae bacterium]|tara:strand:- start:689 stop:1609 length:921 start_codon:yes stop_codon:yes gene_type:complete
MNDSSDIAQGDWIDRKVPEALQPYFRLARIDRPIGVWLLAIPCWWGLGLAFTSIVGASLHEIAKLALLFLIGSFLMRGAGCTWNDILDRDIDAKVARTATRPLAIGRLRLRHAIVFLVLLLTLSALILLALNDFTKLLAVSSLALVALYPLMKRITYWPQAFLGLTFNWGVLLGYATITDALDPAVLVLYAGAFFWTLGYDTIYAHQDKEDDAMVGVKSTALKFGDRSKIWIGVFYTCTMICFAVAGVMLHLNLVYFIALLFPTTLLFTQVRQVDLDNPQDCLYHFKSNAWIGVWLLGAILIGRPF